MNDHGERWIGASLRRSMSDFGRKVANLLDDLYDGIYHIEREVRRVDWEHDRWITICVHDSHYSTFDAAMLTRLVILCHDHCIRCEVQSAGFHRLKLCFSPRQREGQIYDRHPTIESAIEAVRK
jgi:hypothetical protein